MKKLSRFIVLDPAIVTHRALAKDLPAMVLMMWLICNAHARPEPYQHRLHSGTVVTLQRGQLFVALRALAAQVGVTHKVARRVFEKLQRAGTITVEPVVSGRAGGTVKGAPEGQRKGTQAGFVEGTLVTLCNFATYQEFSNYGSKGGHASVASAGHKEGHTGGNQERQQTYPEEPKQNNQPAAAVEISKFLAEFTGETVSPAKLSRLITEQGHAAVVAEAERRAESGNRAFANARDALTVMRSAIEQGEAPQKPGEFLRWRSAPVLEAKRKEQSRSLLDETARWRAEQKAEDEADRKTA